MRDTGRQGTAALRTKRAAYFFFSGRIPKLLGPEIENRLKQ